MAKVIENNQASPLSKSSSSCVLVMKGPLSENNNEQFSTPIDIDNGLDVASSDKSFNNNNNTSDQPGQMTVDEERGKRIISCDNDIDNDDHEMSTVGTRPDPDSGSVDDMTVDVDGGNLIDDRASSCGSEPDDGRLQIVLNNNNVGPTKNDGEGDDEDVQLRSEEDEDDDYYQDQLEVERYRQQQQQLYHQLSQKQLLLQQQHKYNIADSNPAGAGAAASLTVTKFPINGNYGHHGSFGSHGKYAIGGTSSRSHAEIPTTISSSPSQSPELGHGHFHNNNNNNMVAGLSLSNNMMLKEASSRTDLVNGYGHHHHLPHYNKYNHPHGQDQDLRQQQQQHASSRSRMSHRSSHSSSSHGHHGHEPYNIKKLEKKLQSSSPVMHLNEVKPENLATGSQQQQLTAPLSSSTTSSSSPSSSSSSALSRSISNALLNLASLGNLAALQQQQSSIQSPNNNVNHNGLIISNNNINISASATTPTPLNLTNNHSPSNSNRCLTPTTLLNTLSGTNNSNSPSPTSNSPLSSSHYLAQLISQHQLQQQTGSSNNNSMLSNLSPNHTNNSGNSNMPQLILASGSIVQGIQGAQLFIPTSQGLMTQTILTIPITSHGSPSTLPSPPPPSASSSSTPSNSKKNGAHQHSNHHSSSSSRQQQPHISSTLSMIPSNVAQPQARSSSLSPPLSSSRTSPNDFPLLNLTPHLVNNHQQQLLHSQHLLGASSNTNIATSNLIGERQLNMAERSGLSNGHHHHHSMSNSSSNLISATTAGMSASHHAANGKRDINSMHNNPATVAAMTNVMSGNGGGRISSFCQPKLSPCSTNSQLSHDERDDNDHVDHDSDFDKCSDLDDDDDDGEMIEGINLDEIKEFAKAFKLRRLSLGLTQTQVGQALSITEGPSYSQSAICSALAWQLAQSQNSQLHSNCNRTAIPQSSMFEKLDITPKSAQKIKPVLERWMKEAEDRYRNGHQNLNEFVGMEPSKKRKRRTSFTPQALEILNVHFERNTHPSGAEITTLAHQLGYEREVIRIWFCNKRQALKNTVRMMSKGGSPLH